MTDLIPETERVVTADGRTYHVIRTWGPVVVYQAWERDEDVHRELGELELHNVSYYARQGESNQKRYNRGRRACRLAFPEAGTGLGSLAGLQLREEYAILAAQNAVARERGCTVTDVSEDEALDWLVRGPEPAWKARVIQDPLEEVAVYA